MPGSPWRTIRAGVDRLPFSEDMPRHRHRDAYATVVLGGILMMLFGALRLGKLIRMVPHPVMLGFVNGLAIIIARAQFEHFQQPTPHGNEWLHGQALDFPILLGHPKMRTVLVVGLCGLGLLFSMTGIVIGWRRLNA